MSQVWRQQLKVGDQVDVKIDSDLNKKHKGWVQATVVGIEGEMLNLSFPELPAEYDHDLPAWTTDIAEFESKTKADYEWRRSCFANTDTVDYITDMHDLIRWEQGTIFDVREDSSNGRTVLMANCGFRVYVEGGKKVDEIGRFDGWSVRYDELIPVFNQRLQPQGSRFGRTNIDDDDDDLDAGIDDKIKPEAGHDRVYCVPRISTCISAKFISNMNNFGTQGGFAAIQDTL